ncbi:hypothetical protein GCM10017691_40210 [Pseudonocardia petroleophila]|uniref:Dihydrodipicolinate synthase family protein n=1 Tax=Pseudonocardia petroleophila TaxID=37331 RepID=A0A7G7MBV6_9PSEU|nr:dihydrodipicolinate synthase family protein [Pseudonocardia petroleophila]QNG50267.1 dihydrodipicolinate synthase family protein [Pseudonocardia petroleophila]
MTRLTKDDITGLLAIMPTPAVPEAEDPAVADTVDHAETARAVEALISDGVHAVLTNGTFGECATLTWDEHRAFAGTVVETAASRVPVFVGATTLNTRDTIARARTLRDIGADGLLLGRPMWSACDEDATVGFYRAVAEAVPELAIIVYDNPEAFKGKIGPRTYARLAEIPQVVAAKYPGLAGSFLADLDALAGRVRLLPVERDWYYTWRWAPDQVRACWSGAASCGPGAGVALAAAIAAGDAEVARQISEEMRAAGRTFFPRGDFALFSTYNVQLEKIRINEAGYMVAGPARPPYARCPEDFAEGARESGRLLAALEARYRVTVG